MTNLSNSSLPARPDAERALCVAGHITFDISTNLAIEQIDDDEVIPLVDYLLQVKSGCEDYLLPDERPTWIVIDEPVELNRSACELDTGNK